CSSNDIIDPLHNTILDRLCLPILPKFDHKIKWFNLELLSMENFLQVIDYPNLYGRLWVWSN
ncbi:unnamed protein product, partial [Rotaria sp. Silwood1]